MRVRAAITEGKGRSSIDDVVLRDPQRDEVLVQIKASGVCHTDLNSMTWGRRLIMGHEGAGTVVAAGAGVTHVRAGDRVLLNWAIPCGACFQCRRGAENICEQRPVSRRNALTIIRDLSARPSGWAPCRPTRSFPGRRP